MIRGVLALLAVLSCLVGTITLGIEGEDAPGVFTLYLHAIVFALVAIAYREK